MELILKEFSYIIIKDEFALWRRNASQRVKSLSVLIKDRSFDMHSSFPFIMALCSVNEPQEKANHRRMTKVEGWKFIKAASRRQMLDFL